MLGSWKSSGINEAITDKSPTESCNIPQVQVPINEAKQFADACACVPIDKLNLAIQDGSSSKECEQSDKINHDNIGRKDDCLFAPKSFDVNKCHTDQKHVGNVHGIQNEASKGASDNIKKNSKPPYSPKVMALINWAPSFDLGIDDDDQSNMQCQVNAIYQPKGPSEAEHINIEDDVPYVHNDHLEGNYKSKKLSEAESKNGIEAASCVHHQQNSFVCSLAGHGVTGANNVKEVGVDVIDINSQDNLDTTPPAIGVSSMNVINLDYPDVLISSREI